jgi:hypothetical protein
MGCIEAIAETTVADKFFSAKKRVSVAINVKNSEAKPHFKFFNSKKKSVLTLLKINAAKITKLATKVMIPKPFIIGNCVVVSLAENSKRASNKIFTAIMRNPIKDLEAEV